MRMSKNSVFYDMKRSRKWPKQERHLLSYLSPLSLSPISQTLNHFIQSLPPMGPMSFKLSLFLPSPLSFNHSTKPFGSSSIPSSAFILKLKILKNSSLPSPSSIAHPMHQTFHYIHYIGTINHSFCLCKCIPRTSLPTCYSSSSSSHLQDHVDIGKHYSLFLFVRYIHVMLG